MVIKSFNTNVGCSHAYPLFLHLVCSSRLLGLEGSTANCSFVKKLLCQERNTLSFSLVCILPDLLDKPFPGGTDRAD
jgi:hypothetical protein